LVYSLARGGAERMTVELARAWADRGCRVTVLTLAPAETDFFHLDPRVERLQLSFPADPEREVLKSVAANVGRARAIRRVLVRARPDIALGMMSSAAMLLAMAAIGLRMKVFGSERTYPPMMPLGAVKERIRWFTYGLLTGVIGQTEAAGRWLRENTRARRVHVIANHIDLPLRAQSPIIAPTEVLGDDRRCILAVGRMTEEKQFPRLIEAFATLAARFHQWDLVIAGAGPDRPELIERIAETGLEGRIHLPGAVGNIADWYSRADIFAMTSRFEGFPNALLEAMAHGTPPVAFDCMTGPSELICHGESGLLIPLNDMRSLDAGLAKLMADDELRVQMGAKALAIQDQFSTKRATDLWLKAFDLKL
jgi:glycosyltransferase involved in cell wall biosynthesis